MDRVGDGAVAEVEGEGVGTSAALDELAWLQVDDVEAGVEERSRKYPYPKGTVTPRPKPGRMRFTWR